MVGGVTELMRVAALADRYGKRVIPHGYKSNITVACNLAFLGQSNREEILEYSTSQSPLRWQTTNEHFEIGNDGRVEVPARPGLGVTLNVQTLAAYRAT